MSKAENTKKSLLDHGRRLFWSRGYSNVPLRQIASAAGVDVALIARYFGSKQKLFEATLEVIGAIDPAAVKNEQALVERVIEIFIHAPRTAEKPSPVTMILMNAGDSEVGGLVRARYIATWLQPIEQILGNDSKAALFSAALFGMSVAEKTLHLPGIAKATSPAYEQQLRHMLTAALSSPPS